VRTRLTALTSALLLAAAIAVPAFRLALTSDETASATVSVPTSADDEQAEGDDEGDGPPSWANAGGQGKSAKAAGKQAWKRLTKAERHDLMTRLVREHKAGMKAFEACAEAGRDDCEKPLPPGQAKKL
jgi:hypothetical protein